MEQSPAWEAAQFAANQEIPRILWNPQFIYHIYKCPPLVPVFQSEHTMLNMVYVLLQTFYTSQFQISYNETCVSVKI